MRTTGVFCFTASERPGYLAAWLDDNKLPWKMYRLDAGEAFPLDSREFAGIALMGGTISANDPSSWSGPLFALLRDAFDHQVPVIGHCLGGQIMARALGAAVNPANPEIGWGEVDCCGDSAAEWFGGATRFETFHWHYEAFELPAMAQRLLTNASTVNQAFLVDGRHVGLQCHMEVDLLQLQTWCRLFGDTLPTGPDPSRQTREQVLDAASGRIASLRPVTKALYDRWARGLRL
jgi:GMP synthase-like glutamine amidotransferase